MFLAMATWSQTGSSIVQQGIAVLAVFIRAADHLSLTEMGLLTSATSLGVVAGFLLAGPQVDRRGPRLVLAAGSVWAALAMLLVSQRVTLALLACGLMWLGSGLAVFPSSGTRAVFDAFRADRRGFVMGIRQTGVVLGSAVAASVLPTVVAAMGVRRVFLVEGLLLLAAGLPFAFVMQARGGGHVAAPGRTWRELKGALAPFAVAALLVSAQYCPLAFVMTDLHDVQRWSWAAAGLGLAAMQVGGGLGRVGLGWLSDRTGNRPRLIVAAALVAAAGAFTLGVWAPGAAPALLPVVLLVFGMGAVGWNALTLTWAGERVPRSRSGQAMSMTGAVVFAGSAVYPPLFGAMVDATHTFQTAWWALAALLLVAAGMTAVLGRGRGQTVAGGAA